MAYQSDGTLSADGYAGSEDGVQVSGHVTACCHNDLGGGTMTWQFKGPAGEWKSVIGGSGSTTVQAFTAAHMVNFFFGGDVLIRGSLSGSSSPDCDWELLSSSLNRGR